MLSEAAKLIDLENENNKLRKSIELWSSSGEFHGLYPEIAKNTLVDVSRCYMLHQWAKYSQKLDGDMAEVGVYKGGTASLIAKTCPHKTLHLFDTFSGMPETDKTVDVHKQGDFADTSLEQVQKYLRDCQNVNIYQGMFPDTARQLDSERFCFVHVDVDIYDSVKSCLDYFYDKLVPGGVLIFDDYEWKACPGVKKALDEFLADKPESIIITVKYQCILIKSSGLKEQAEDGPSSLAKKQHFGNITNNTRVSKPPSQGVSGTVKKAITIWSEEGFRSLIIRSIKKIRKRL